MKESEISLESIPEDSTVEDIVSMIERRVGSHPARIFVDVDKTLTTGNGEPWYEKGLGPETNEPSKSSTNSVPHKALPANSI